MGVANVGGSRFYKLLPQYCAAFICFDGETESWLGVPSFCIPPPGSQTEQTRVLGRGFARMPARVPAKTTTENRIKQ
jgi:hypothetical protein